MVCFHSFSHPKKFKHLNNWKQSKNKHIQWFSSSQRNTAKQVLSCSSAKANVLGTKISPLSLPNSSFSSNRGQNIYIERDREEKKFKLEIPSVVFISRFGIDRRCKSRSLRPRHHGSPFQIRFELSLMKSGVWVPIRRRWRVRNRQNSTSINHLLITQLSSLSLEITQLSTFFLSLSSVSLLPNTKFPSFLVPTHSLFVGAQISCVLTGHLSICYYYFILFFIYISIKVWWKWKWYPRGRTWLVQSEWDFFELEWSMFLMVWKFIKSEKYFHTEIKWK